ncbi:MAG TPA: ATP-binding protein, partial [Thermoanaerobaculia bacterium]|nr:ATP-binding protein [Thermoanaerobaculia bacterium]
GVTVAVEAPEGLDVTGDRRRLAQVLRNLVDNAIKFSPSGARVDVLAEALAAAAGEPPRAVIHVVDRGIGIPRSELKNIFQRFYRVDPSRAKSVPGTGLGLAIVKHLLILHHGSIAVESEPGKGSRFSVTLPAATAQGAAVQETT